MSGATTGVDRGHSSLGYRQHCRRLRGGGWRHFRCKAPARPSADSRCALCGKETPSFAHAALEQAAYAGLEEKTRRSLHGQAAAWLLQESPPEKEPPLEELARHLFFSDHPESARESLERAGRQALRQGGLREASTCLGRAIQVSREPADLFSSCLLREEVWGRLGRKEEQLEDIGRLRELADENLPLWRKVRQEFISGLSLNKRDEAAAREDERGNKPKG